MATLAVAHANRSGVQMSPVAAAGGGDDFPNDGKTLYLVFNAGASICNVDFALSTDPHAAEPTQSTTVTPIAVAIGEDHVIGPFPTPKFGSSVAVTYDQVTSVTVLPLALS